MPASPTPQPGDTFGRYRLVQLIGAGGLGSVLKAVDDQGTPYAVKVVNAEADPAGAERLRQEAALARLVDHPNVVRVVAAGEEPPYTYLVMEFVAGVSLKSCLEGAKRLHVHEAVYIAGEVLRALEALDARGIVHCDVKPWNILVAPAGGGSAGSASPPRFAVKLVDFGIARFIKDMGSGERAESVVGTPAYMAPEQWQRPETVDGRADVYGLGCTLFELLCGRPPFQGQDLHRLMLQHADAPRPDPYALRGDVGPELSAVIRRMLAVKLEDRYPSAAAARAALEQAFHLWKMATVAPEEGEPLFPAEGEEPPRPAAEPSPITAEAAPAPAVPSTAATKEDAAPAAPQQAARRLGPYELREQLWRDFASAMYQARDTVLDVDVAVEVLHEHLADRDLLVRFRRRARAGAVINHPNVHRVFALHQVTDGPPRGPGADVGPLAYCVLEPLLGRTLKARLDGPLLLPEALAIAEQVLLALHAIHAHGLVHRDVKPANIFLQQLTPVRPPNRGPGPGRDPPAWAWPWIVKLTGFLIVRDTEAHDSEPLTHHGTGMGTAAYMAPEQAAASDRADARADLYSLGCVLFEMVCGRPPFTGATPIHVLLAHRDDAAPDPAAVRSDVPPALGRLIRRLLAKRPEDRYQSAAEVLEALEEVRAARVGSRPAETRGDGDEATAETHAGKRLNHLLRLDDRAYSSDLVVTHYPAPVALAYRRFCRQAEPRARLDRLFYAAEAGLRYLVTLGLCDLLHGQAAAGATLALPDHEAFDFLRRPVPMQLGMWLSALRETARALACRPDRFLTELPEVCEPGGRLDRDVLGRLIAHRNDTAHAGGIPVTDDECQARVREARPLLEEFLGTIRFLCAYPLGFVQRGVVADRQAEGRHGYYLHSCMGAGVENTIQAYHIETPSPLEEHFPFVVSGDGTRLLYLWPFLGQRVSPVSVRHTLYAFEDLPDRRRPFLTYVRSTALDVREEWLQLLRDQPADSPAWLLERLRALRAVSAVPADLDVPVKLMPWRGGALTGLKVNGLELLAPVGRGGFGTIYAAATPSGERVAVKVLESASASPRQLERFRAEFARLQGLGKKLAGAADPPGIIRCFESHHALLDGRVYPWYSMEFALGGDLGGRIEERKGGRLGQAVWADPECRPQVTDEFRQVAAAVAYLHEQHLIHRDLKPSNVLILENGRLCLSDFGLAKHLGSAEGSVVRGPMTSTGAVLGTRYYMAPEQEKGQDVAEPADVYALGILLAELAVGDRPAPNTGTGQGSTLQGWRRLMQLPDPLRRFVLRLTDVDPGRRPPSGRAVQHEFEAALQRIG